jgi:hypothetical protein
MNEQEYKLAGYRFTDMQAYKEVKKELETIEYIRANTDLSEIGKVTKLYHKLVERKTLKTIVGYMFLKELQDKIVNEGIISRESVPAIHIEVGNKISKTLKTSFGQETVEKQAAKLEDYRIRIRNSRIINIFMVVIIIAMIAISIFSDRSVFINYENEIVNKYASWDEELNNRQKILDEKEKMLEEKEDNLNSLQ